MMVSVGDMMTDWHSDSGVYERAQQITSSKEQKIIASDGHVSYVICQLRQLFQQRQLSLTTYLMELVILF